MKRQDKADKIAQQLEALYPEVPVPLDHTDAFTLLVAVLLSAQTTDKKVNEVTPALFEVAGNPTDMAACTVEELRVLIREIGLAPTKAKNLKNLAIRMLDVYGGIVPQTFEDLETLPGVGHKTASVVMSQAFGVPAFPVDTHIHRLAARWGLSNDTNVDRTERDLKALFPRDRWNKLHLQIIFFGREYCPARFHDLTTCPICQWSSTKTRQRAEATMNRPKKRAKSS